MVQGETHGGDGAKSSTDISVVIAVCNDLPYLRTCLSTLEQQTIDFSRLEVFLVDDCSSDGSSDVCTEFAAEHPWASVIHSDEVVHPGKLLNRALEMTRGRYVFIGEGDIYFGVETFEKIVENGDELGSDIIVLKPGDTARSRFPGVLFKDDIEEADLAEPGILNCLDICKAYRSDLFSNGLRFGETGYLDDAVMVVRAYLESRKTSVVCDYDYFCYSTARVAGLTRFHSMLRSIRGGKVPAYSFADSLVTLSELCEAFDDGTDEEASTALKTLCVACISNALNAVGSFGENGYELSDKDSDESKKRHEECGRLCALAKHYFDPEHLSMKNALPQVLTLAAALHTTNPDVIHEVQYAVVFNNPPLVWLSEGDHLICRFVSKIDSTCSFDVDVTELRIFDYSLTSSKWENDGVVFSGELYYAAKEFPHFVLSALLKGNLEHRCSFPLEINEHELAPHGGGGVPVYGHSFKCRIDFKTLVAAGVNYRADGVVKKGQPARWDLFLSYNTGEPKMRFGAHRVADAHTGFLEGAAVVGSSLITSHETVKRNMTLYESTAETDTKKAPFAKAEHDLLFNRLMMTALRNGRFEDACAMVQDRNNGDFKPVFGFKDSMLKCSYKPSGADKTVSFDVNEAGSFTLDIDSAKVAAGKLSIGGAVTTRLQPREIIGFLVAEQKVKVDKEDRDDKYVTKVLAYQPLDFRTKLLGKFNIYGIRWLSQWHAALDLRGIVPAVRQRNTAITFSIVLVMDARRSRRVIASCDMERFFKDKGGVLAEQGKYTYLEASKYDKPNDLFVVKAKRKLLF